MPRALAAMVGCAVLAVGCRGVPEPSSRSPLKPAHMASESVGLDVLFVRFPFGEPEANGPVWEEIDETPWPGELRHRLALNGFRVGLVAGPIPIALSKLLELKDKPAPSGATQTVTASEWSDEPRVLRRFMSLRSGQRGEIIASGVYDELAVLWCGPSGVEGQTYSQAQALLAIWASLEPDGRVRLKLVPELHHGQAKPRLVGQTGAVRLEASRPKQVFPEMTIQVPLGPGQLLVLSSLPQRPGSLGHHFFTHRRDGKLEQKLLVIRLSRAPHDGLFDPPDLLSAKMQPEPPQAGQEAPAAQPADRAG